MNVPDVNICRSIWACHILCDCRKLSGKYCNMERSKKRFPSPQKINCFVKLCKYLFYNKRNQNIFPQKIYKYIQAFNTWQGNEKERYDRKRHFGESREWINSIYDTITNASDNIITRIFLLNLFIFKFLWVIQFQKILKFSIGMLK